MSASTINAIKHEKKAWQLIQDKKIQEACVELDKARVINPGSIGVLRLLTNVFIAEPNEIIFDKIQESLVSFFKFQKKTGKHPSSYENVVHIINSRLMRTFVYSEKHPVLKSKIYNRRNHKSAKKLIILTCIWQRRQLTELFLRYFSKLRDLLKPHVELDLLAIGSEGDLTADLVQSFCFNYLNYPNKPVSQKWEHGIRSLRNFEFDGVIILGSDDLIDEVTIHEYVKALDEGLLFFGFRDVYFYDPIQYNLLYWPGYCDKSSPMPERTLETIGLGRFLSKELIEMMGYSIWGDHKANSSLDSYMHKRLVKDFKLLPVLHSRDKVDVFVNGFKIGLACSSFKQIGAVGVDIKSDVNITPVNKIKCLSGVESFSKDEASKKMSKFVARVGREKFNRAASIDVSVIILAHKESSYLEQCIVSVKNQKFSGNFEIILASDSNEQLSSYAKKFSLQFSLSKKEKNNKSCSKSLNEAVDLSRGTYIKFVAYDDFLPENSLQDLYDEAVRSEASLVYANAYQYYSDDRIVKYIPPKNSVTVESQAEKNIIHGGSILFKRKDFILLGGFDTSLDYAEEFEFYFRILTYGLPLSYTDNFVYYYRRHAEQKGTFALSDKEKLDKAALVKSIGEKYRNVKICSKSSKALSGSIVFGLASIENRCESLVETVNSIYNQADKIYIYQNGYKNFNLLHDPALKISYVSSLDTGIDQGDAGKFYFVEKIEDCFYFSIDDDLLYPPDYAKILINKINNSEDGIAVSCHGKVFKTQATNWFLDIEYNYRCLDAELDDMFLQFGGTGVTAFHTSYCKPPFSFFKKNNMADCWFGLYAKEIGMKILGVSHAEGWIKVTPAFKTLDNKTTIYADKRKSHSDAYENILLQQFQSLVFGSLKA